MVTFQMLVEEVFLGQRDTFANGWISSPSRITLKFGKFWNATHRLFHPMVFRSKLAEKTARKQQDICLSRMFWKTPKKDPQKSWASLKINKLGISHNNFQVQKSHHSTTTSLPPGLVFQPPGWFFPQTNGPKNPSWPKHGAAALWRRRTASVGSKSRGDFRP